MNPTLLQEIAQIIERDSKDTTYKFALLRGTIEVIQARSPYIEEAGDRMRIPLGLLVERWLLYYYPIIAADEFIPQKNGEKDRQGVRLAFRPQLRRLTDFYRQRGGFSAFYHDLVHRGMPEAISDDFLQLCRKVSDTIVNMPMKYIGWSVFSEYYRLFTPYKKKFVPPQGRPVDLGWLIHAFGTFLIPRDYYDIFALLGSFLSGMDGILFHWAAFTVNVSGGAISMEEALSYLLTGPERERDVEEARRLYNHLLQQEGTLTCVWTDKAVRKFDVDHVIPFSAWRNNHLWNLLPASPPVNNRKRDKVPAPDLLDRRRDAIIHYWETAALQHPRRFQQELHLALLGDTPAGNWQAPAFDRLRDNCRYLIDVRGHEAWEGH